MQLSLWNAVEPMPSAERTERSQACLTADSCVRGVCAELRSGLLEHSGSSEDTCAEVDPRSLRPCAMLSLVATCKCPQPYVSREEARGQDVLSHGVYGC